MRTTMTKTVGAASLALLTMLGAPMSASAADDELHLGVMIWMRGEYGFKNWKTIEARFEEINEAGGINGRKVKLTAFDTECKPNVGVDIVTKLAHEQKVLLIMGAACSAVTLATMPISTKAEVPQITPMSTNRKITEQGSDWIFRVSVSDRFYSQAMGEYIYHNLGKRVAYVYATDAAGFGFSQGVRDYLKDTYGLEPTVDEVYQEKSVDVRPQLLKAKRSDPDVLLFSGLMGELARGIKQSYEVGIPREITRVHTSAASVAEVPDLAGDDIIGSTYVAAFTASNPDPKIQEFVKWVKDRFDVLPDHNYAQSDDMVWIVKEAIERADIKNTPDSLAADRAALRDALAETKNFRGVGSGPITFCREPTADCRDGNRTALVLQYTKGGRDYEIKFIQAIEVPRE